MTERRAGVGVWIATCAGIGYFPFAPGTAGSALGVVLVVLLDRLPFSRAGLTAVLGLATGGLFALGVWAGGKAEEFFERLDPGAAVIDEVVGQMIVFLERPHASWIWLLGGFLLFRFFDIVKPYPGRRAEKVHGGWGIMLDDAVAGAYGFAVLWALGLALK